MLGFGLMKIVAAEIMSDSTMKLLKYLKLLDILQLFDHNIVLCFFFNLSYNIRYSPQRVISYRRQPKLCSVDPGAPEEVHVNEAGTSANSILLGSTVRHSFSFLSKKLQAMI